MLLRTTGIADRYRLGVDRIAHDRVSKFVGPNAETEFHKALAVERALAGSVFSTPKPLAFDVDTGRVEFEFVPDTIHLLEFMERAYQHRDIGFVLQLNRSAADLLALLHRNLTLPSAAQWTPPDYLVQDAKRHGCAFESLSQIYMHCDFSPVNILVKPTGALVLIDASPNYYFTYRADLKGPRLVAVANYTTKLFWPFRFRTYSPFWRRMVHVLRNEFIERYAQQSGVPVDRSALCLFERAVVRSFVTWKTPVVPVRWVARLLGRISLPDCSAR